MRFASGYLYVLLLSTVCAVSAVDAQSSAQQSATATINPDVKSGDPTTGGAYIDRVMEGIAPDETDKSDEAYDRRGWSRGLSVQFTRNVQTSKNNAALLTNTRTETQGFQIDTFIDAPNFGTLSLQALALGGSNVSGLSSWSLRQVGLPFDNGWRVDNALGTTNLAMPDSSRRSSRLTLPGPQLIGGSTQWRRLGTDQFGNDDLRFGASVGEPGRFEGFPQSRFEGSGGRVSNVFAEVTRGPWTFAATAAEGNNIVPESGFVNADSMNTMKRISPSNIYLSTAWRDRGAGFDAPGFVVQLNAIGSRADSVSSTGVYADINWRNGAHRHETSVFYLERGLMWLDRALAADLQGAAYRYGYNSTQWDITGNVEAFDSISGASPGGWFASGGTRYQLSTKLSVGGGFATRDFGGQSSSGFGYLQSTSSLGTSRAQVDASTSDNGPSSQALTLEHSFYTESSLSLSTTLSVERIKPERAQALNDSTGNSITSSQRPVQNAFAVGLNGRYLLTDTLSAQGNLRARQLRNVDNRGNNDFSIALNFGLDWQITPSWSFNASVYENRGIVTDSILVESPLATPTVVRSRPNDRGVFISLRYNVRAGSSVAPLGGRVGSGTGTGKIEGSVFLDTNANGRRDGNESGAANVIVILDGRYSTRSDANGNYQFSDVASGPHKLNVVQDDLPLPWTMEIDRRYDAPVSTRNTTRIDMGARRIP